MHLGLLYTRFAQKHITSVDGTVVEEFHFESECLTVNSCKQLKNAMETIVKSVLRSLNQNYSCESECFPVAEQC